MPTTLEPTTTLGASTLWEAFQRAVAAAPSACALALPTREISFRDLEQESIRCASWLAAKGLRAGQRVALALPKTRAAYVLWLACLRQGLVYVFVDPRNPAHRTAQILTRVEPALFVTADDGPSVLPSVGPATTIRLPGDDQGDGDGPWLGAGMRLDAAPPGRVHGLSPAYIMFTSGSTGEPKGAVIPHQGVLNLMRWVRMWIAAPAQERFANLNPLHFDNSVFDLYCGLLSGATLVPIETVALHNPLAWVKALRQGRASVVFAVPTLFMTLDRLRLLDRHSLPDVRTFLFGGEGFPIEALRRFHSAFRGHARLINVYGPTETSCICSSLEIDDAALDAAGDGLASLGRMHDGFMHAILDEHQSPVPRGEVGELWIGGANVGLGYFADPSETDRRFRQDPLQNRYRSIWYRSGDLVCEDRAGLLWFHGRADNQVKIRGHRIELEEVDLALEAFPSILRAVSALVYGPDGPEIRAAVCGKETIEPEVIRAHCAERLPSYMQPARIVQVETLPQNANGKVDRRAAGELLERLD